MQAPNELIALALDVVSTRLMIFLAMLGMFALASWVMYAPDVYRLACLVVWGLFIFLPVIKLEAQQKEQQS